MNTIDHALENGYTVALDCDVSEKTFSSKQGVAVIPAQSSNNEKALEGVYPEKEINQNYRQQEFENFNTTDDHLMHITGLVKDQNDVKYYKTKNSWGTNNGFEGYWNMSEEYMRLHTVAIMVHKNAVPKER